MEPKCQSCGALATCIGACDDEPLSYACDDCCDHSQEDGNVCVALDDVIERVQHDPRAQVT